MKKIVCLFFLLMGIIPLFAQTRPSFYDIKKPIVYVEEFHAKGNGTTDDTDAIKAAFKYALDRDYDIGFTQGKTYLIKSRVAILNTAGDVSKTYNLRVFGNGATLKCGTSIAEYNSGFSLPPLINIKFLDCKILGFRSDISTEPFIQPYPGPVPSWIQPENPHVIFTNTSATAGEITFSNCGFSHIFGSAVIISLGANTNCNFNSCQFLDIAENCLFITSQETSSVLILNSTIKDTGLLPDSFTVGGNPTTFDGSVYNLRDSYGCFVQGGVLRAEGNTVTNYTSSAFCSHGGTPASTILGTSLYAINNKITCDSTYCRSDNPSFAIVGEWVSAMTANDNIIRINTRNASDTAAFRSVFWAFIQPNGKLTVDGNDSRCATKPSQQLYVSASASTTHYITNNTFIGATNHSIIGFGGWPGVATASPRLAVVTGNTYDMPPHFDNDTVAIVESDNSGFVTPNLYENLQSYRYNESTQVNVATSTVQVASFTELTLAPGVWMVTIRAHTTAVPAGATLQVNAIASTTAASMINTTLDFTGLQETIYVSEVVEATDPNRSPRRFTSSGIYRNTGDSPVTLYLNIRTFLSLGTIGIFGRIEASRLH